MTLEKEMIVIYMVKRILDSFASDFNKIKGKDLLISIAASEGRTVIAEVVVTAQPLIDSITNAELACAFGSDIILLNMLDVHQPVIQGMPPVKNKDETIKILKELIGRPVGVNLEPTTLISPGRRATAETARRALEIGIDLIVLTGNPKTGVTNSAIINAVREIRSELKDEIIIAAGKMHCSGIQEESSDKIVDAETVHGFVEAGADIILFPAPGTVPGMTIETVKKGIDAAHAGGKLAMVTIGTSQEGADPDTIKAIALQGKMAGADIFHIGDAGYSGIALPENIMNYSIAIRGRRHTFRRMAASIKR
nr:haloacid dehalogenase-like hydrolase [Koleobacter methoxysyntrophicus]